MSNHESQIATATPAGETCTPMTVGVYVEQVTTDAQAETVIEALDKLDILKRAVKQLEADMNDAVLEWLKKNGQLEIGDVKFYAGVDKTIKCKDMPRAVEILLDITNDDWSEFMGCLSSNAVKHGAARKLFNEAGMPDLFDELFETVVKDVVKVQRIDTKFLPKRKD